MESTERIQRLFTRYPHLTDRMVREILALLHSRGIVTIDQLYDEARLATGDEPLDRQEEADPNRPQSVRWEERERSAVLEVVLRYATEHLEESRVEEVLNDVRRTEEAESLESLASLPDVPFRLLADRVRRFCALPRGRDRFSKSGVIGTRVALIRNIISDQLEFIGVSKRYLRMVDFEQLLDRVISPDHGQGRIGGKAAGILLGYRILRGAQDEHADDPAARVLIPESWFLRSDVIQLFLRHNGFDEYQNQKYKEPEEVRREYPLIRQMFRNAEFPAEIVQKLEKLLAAVGNHPLIVRSSSLLEDRFGAAFSGMYASIFLGNQGKPRDRLQELLGAIAEVYASTLSPDPIQYRRRRNLIDYNEDMGIIIQKVVGRRHGRYFLPDIAGVAFSRNEYRWSPRIKPEDGMARVVAGLGTRAVDRTGNDYSRIVALGAPTLRPEVTPDKVIRYSQRYFDVVDLEQNRFRNVSIGDLMAEGPGAPGLDLAASVISEGTLVEPVAGIMGVAPSNICLTFDRLLNRTPFAARMRQQLSRLEDAYQVPINVEYAINGDEVHLLQCRPLVQAEAAEFIRLPRRVPSSRQLFYTREVVRAGEVRRIDHVVYVDPRAYDRIGSQAERTAVARAVARVNDALEGSRFLMLGPGRWGSNDSRLGVKVSYADINHCSVLIEVALATEGFVPEVSYGTHFFQELVEDGIFYLPLHPEERGVLFNQNMLLNAPNALGKISEQDAGLSEVIHVVRVAEAMPGKKMHLVMDANAREAMCWVE